MPYNLEFALSVMDRIAKGIDPEFCMNDQAKPIYEQMIRFIHADPEFNGDLEKGFILLGPTGTGKTIAMEVLQRYRQIDNTKMIVEGKVKSMNFDVIRSTKIISDYTNEGIDGIELYTRRLVICIDDLGTEPDTAKNYGNTIDVMGYILAERYAKRLMTLATTNLTYAALESRYDDRIMSRMRALFNFIEMNGKDYRK
jgi:DNA replication protein DnaC